MIKEAKVKHSSVAAGYFLVWFSWWALKVGHCFTNVYDFFILSLLAFPSKDTIHAILKFQSSPANDPLSNNVRFLLWLGLLFLTFPYCAFLETYGNII